jgi:hypothetical protein
MGKTTRDQVREVGWVGDDSHVVFGRKLPLDIIHFLFNLESDILETGFCLLFKVVPNHGTEDKDRTQFPKCHILNKKQDVG